MNTPEKPVSNTQETEIQAERSAGQQPDRLPFWRVMLSVIQAALGVQNQANKERDFSQKSIVPFVIAALVFTAAFVGCLVVVVKLVLSAES